MPSAPVADEISGFHMLYSSGTTGRPKGIAVPFTPGPIDEFNASEGRPAMYQAFDPLVTMNVGPLYHAAPLSGMVNTHRLGGTFVTTRKFGAEATLKAIQDWRVNNAQFVPTMFVRMLALPDEVRARYDLTSLKLAIHAAAPCPVEIKRRMIDWWGPILFEYYSSTEGVGATGITSEEWLQKPGSVGRTSMGPIHICDEDGRELPAGEAGVIWFEAPPDRKVAYLNDPEKARKATHPEHANWFTVGDIGRLDQDGYLFLTDRKDFMIISGGVNIYPQAIEDCLIVHPKVADAAVIGVANVDYGEEVKAIIEPKDWAEAGPELEAELHDWCASRISSVTRNRAHTNSCANCRVSLRANLPSMNCGKSMAIPLPPFENIWFERGRIMKLKIALGALALAMGVVGSQPGIAQTKPVASRALCPARCAGLSRHTEENPASGDGRKNDRDDPQNSASDNRANDVGE